MSKHPELPPFSGGEPRCTKCGYEGAYTQYRPTGECEHSTATEIVIGLQRNPRLCRTCCRCGHGWDEATVAADDQPAA